MNVKLCMPCSWREIVIPVGISSKHTLSYTIRNTIML